MDPLKIIYEKYGCDISEIKRIEAGERFIALVLENKNLGVCARLGSEIYNDKTILKNPDLKNINHRVLLTAYFNAKLNYVSDYKEKADIVDDVVSGNYSDPVMIGYFSSLVEKIKDKGINLAVFDLKIKNEHILPIELQKEYLLKADSVIMSSTAILNQTFSELLEYINVDADIFIVGPSSVLCPEIFVSENIKKIHGAVFNQEDEKVIEMILEGKIPKEFLKYGKKVFIRRRNL